MLNTKPISFENHFSLRVMEIQFPEGWELTTPEHLSTLKTAWIQNLKSWHSPYTCLFDLRNFVLAPQLEGEFAKLIKYFQGFFMRRIVGYRAGEPSTPRGIPFEVFATYSEARAQTGLARADAPATEGKDLRSSIKIDNDFGAHVMEIDFQPAVHFETAADIQVLKSKLTNILMQWHTPYSVLICCTRCTFSPVAQQEFSKIASFLKGFFCKKIIGYAPKADKDQYPFETFRSRHLAAANLSHSGLQSGEKAHCRSGSPR